MGVGAMQPTAGGFRELRVWQAAMLLVEHVYRTTADFPRHERWGLASQMQRASVSIPSNIAEGHTREHLPEYLQHIAIAHASLAELQTQAEIACRLGYVGDEVAQTLQGEMTSLSKQLYALRNSLSRRPVRPNTQDPTPNTLT
jgi:four helix bundle protein